MSFRIGQRVRCVKVGAWRDSAFGIAGPGPRFGEIVVVAHVVFAPDSSGGAAAFLAIVGQSLEGGVTPVYAAWHFRAVEDAELERLRDAVAGVGTLEPA
jgi:hypothetical protein